MKVKKIEKKLRLNKLTIADLSVKEMAEMFGGKVVNTGTEDQLPPSVTGKCVCDPVAVDADYIVLPDTEEMCK